MKKIFLSASIPYFGRPYFEDSNPLLIREAIVAFTRVCMEYNIEFYFGGHPAISPLVYQIAKNYLGDKDAPIRIYQSEWFKDMTPIEIKYFGNIVWTPKCENRDSSVQLMRKQMFEDNKDTCCAVFIGGMEGIIDEAEKITSFCPEITMLPMASTGCASAKVYQKMGIYNADMESNYVFLLAFRKLLEPFKNI